MDLFEIIKNEKLEQKSIETPAVKSLRGILKGHNIIGNDDKKYLEEKYSWKFFLIQMLSVSLIYKIPAYSGLIIPPVNFLAW